jgi:hypothetical protein
MHFPDLATECQGAGGSAVRAIGWLEGHKPYPTGPAHPDFLACLRAHLTDAGRWLPCVSAGVHFCDLGGCERPGGSHYVIIPSTNCVYVAPDLVVHYIEQHAYAPPAEFVVAALACPEQSSEAYVALVLPFATTIWGIDEATVRRIAASAPGKRKAHADADAVARRDASKGGFKW